MTPDEPPLRPRLLSHVNSVVADLEAAEALYASMLGGRVFFRDYSEPEDRDASLLLVGDTCLELFAPRGPGSGLGRFLERRGPALHSFEWEVADVVAAAEVLQAEGVRLPTHMPGVFFMTHPKDTFGMVLEVCGIEMPNDPRSDPGWVPDPGPAGLVALDALTAAVPDLDEAVAWFTRQTGGVVAYRRLSRGRTVVGLDVGVHLLELEQATEDRPAGLRSVEFVVADIPTARAHFAAVGLRVDPTQEEGSLEVDARDTLGVTYRFSAAWRPRAAAQD